MNFPKIIIGSNDSNIIFAVVKPETKRCVCACGKKWHYKGSKYCSACGQKLEGGR